jgi:hypothetical protein
MRTVLALPLVASFACLPPAAPLPPPTDAGSSDDDPIAAPAETWTWVDLPETACANGAPTGLGVNLTTRSQDLVVYLEGGGACWDANTCFVLKAAAHVESGYGAAAWASDPVKGASAWRRSDPANPLRDASFAVIPYCTGDLYAGDRDTTYELLGQQRTLRHRGARNVEAYLRRLAATFPDARRVWVMGSSAGGYGVQLNLHRFVAAFPEAEVSALSDCGPLVPAYDARLSDMQRAWDTQVAPGCDGCATDFPRLAAHLATAYPDVRQGLLAYEADGVISLYFGYPADGSYAAATGRLLASAYDPHENARYFMLPGNAHTMLGAFDTLAGPGGVSLRTWVSRWATGDAAWASAR